MQITYIDHSGFLVETKNNLLLFDYWRGALPPFNADKKLTIFVSHHHPDHFNPQIFVLGEARTGTEYILGSDISLSPRKRQLYGISDDMLTRTHKMHANERLRINDMEILALKSTDAGAAFFVRSDEGNLYHAGDLNLWIWGENAEADQRMRERYLHATAPLKEESIDAAFLPLDPRLGETFYCGVDDFARRFAPKHIFPMHRWDDADVIARLKSLPNAADYARSVAEIHASGDRFTI